MYSHSIAAIDYILAYKIGWWGTTHRGFRDCFAGLVKVVSQVVRGRMAKASACFGRRDMPTALSRKRFGNRRLWQNMENCFVGFWPKFLWTFPRHLKTLIMLFSLPQHGLSRSVLHSLHGYRHFLYYRAAFRSVGLSPRRLGQRSRWFRGTATRISA